MKFLKKHPRKLIFSFFLFSLFYWYILPKPLFQDPTSIVLEDKNGNLLGARIAKDGQWRFPYQTKIPEKFQKAIIEFEDRRFWWHPGIDPIGLGRAVRQNIANQRVVSGGSTLSMQVIRLATKASSRNIFQKLWEMLLATRLELGYSKKEILAFYASSAPFGGNVVGLDAASWRYYAKKPELLSWAEAATLAVLPNAPSLIHPSKNRQALLEKRNRLLKRLFENGDLEELEYELALEEPLPEKPHPLPQLAPHLLDRAAAEKFDKKGEEITRIETTIDNRLQQQVNRIIERYNQILKNNEIHNLAALVVEVETGNMLAYCGNAVGTGTEHGEAVDIIKAPRSTGSILKPLLFANALDDGTIMPNSLIPDIPTKIGSYRPENFFESFDGVVPAKRAVIRSLNIPLVLLLQNYGLEKFHFDLKQMNFHSIKKTPDWYGLTLILGGAEASLWEITNAYTCMARTLNHFHETDGEYFENDFRNLEYDRSCTQEAGRQIAPEKLPNPPILSASAIYQTFEAIQKLERPDSEGNWERFGSTQKLAWKTGTSFGFRDAWAVGVTPKYAIGVWAGNADGEGRPSLVGVKSAAPILFDILDLLPNSGWFIEPVDEMIEAVVCKESGFKALNICPKDTILATPSSENARTCPYHKTIHLDETKTFQVNANCESPSKMAHESWFILPPIEEYFYKSRNPNYQNLPPFREDCGNATLVSNNAMQLIYPKNITQIFVPKDLDGNLSRTVFKVAHRNPEITIFWHLDNEYLGSTKTFHNFELAPQKGHHVLTLVDELGNSLEENFEIIGKD